MARATYWQKLRDPRWQKRRLEIMNRDSFACRMCNNDRDTLNVHHLAYQRDGEPWDTPDDLLLTLCEACHEEFHDTNPGANWIATLVAAGARWDHVHILREYFGHITDGPYPRQYTRDEWDVICRGVFELLCAVEDGVTTDDIVDALGALSMASRARRTEG